LDTNKQLFSQDFLPEMICDEQPDEYEVVLGVKDEGISVC